MRVRLKPVVAALVIAGAILPNLVQAAENSQENNNASLQKLAMRAQNLEMQLASLQKEMRTMRGQVQSGKKYATNKKSKTRLPRDFGATQVQVAGAQSDANQDRPTRLRGRDLIKLIREEREYLPFDLDVPGQAFVSTGPYVGVPIQYSGSNLIVNSPSVNTDVQLLGIRKSIHQQLMAMGGEIFKEPYHSHLLLSGALSGQAGYLDHSGAANGGSPSTNIDVTNVSFDSIILGPSDWTLAFVEFSYDNSSPANSVYTSNSSFTPTSSYNSYTLSNSRLFVNKAFVTIGDFAKTPFYATLGQFYVPYGVYSSVFLTSPITQSMGRTKARSILLGFQQQDYAGFYGAAFIFKGDSHASATTQANNGGLNLGYKYGKDYIRASFGASVIANIADSGGMQLSTGFGDGYEQLVRRVPGYNLRANFGLGERWDFIGEFIGTTNSFSPLDMSFNGHGAKPWAVDGEVVYSFYILDNRPSSIGVGYQKSNEALALGIPSSRSSAVFRTSLFRNTLQGLEFRHDREYAASNTASGGGAVASSAQTGQSDNAITAEFDYYF